MSHPWYEKLWTTASKAEISIFKTNWNQRNKNYGDILLYRNTYKHNAVFVDLKFKIKSTITILLWFLTKGDATQKSGWSECVEKSDKRVWIFHNGTYPCRDGDITSLTTIEMNNTVPDLGMQFDFFSCIITILI